MKKALVLTLLVAVLGLALPISALSTERRDGNWWIDQSKDFQLEYVVGFFDGMSLGHDFSIWKWFDSTGTRPDPCIAKTTDSYSEYQSKYLADVTNGQLVDGLNTFYKDYRNRKIRVTLAVWLVLNGIAGTPEDRLNKMIESFRRNASE